MVVITFEEVSSISVDRSRTFLAAATCALLLSSRRSARLSAVSLASSTMPPPNSVNARTNSAKFDTDSNRSKERATCRTHANCHEAIARTIFETKNNEHHIHKLGNYDRKDKVIPRTLLIL